MKKKVLLILSNLIIALNLACANTPTSNSATNRTAVVTNTNQANLPEGLSTNQIPLSSNSTPGIPDPKSIDANSGVRGAASTPGIPDTSQSGKNPSATKTPKIPGIPDEETLRKEMTTPADRSVMDRKPPELNSSSNNRPAAKPRATRNP